MTKHPPELIAYAERLLDIKNRIANLKNHDWRLLKMYILFTIQTYKANNFKTYVVTRFRNKLHYCKGNKMQVADKEMPSAKN